MAKILIVDDDPDFRDSVKSILEDGGFEVTAAENGAEGLKKALASPPNLFILDVMMTTDSEGFELARELKKNPVTQNIPAIILTGIRKAKGLPFSFEPDSEWLPVKAVLEKPVTPEKLLKTVRSALGKA